METSNKPENTNVQETPLFFSEALKQIVADFSLRSQEIIFTRYGVFNSHALTLEEIGKKYSITRERVRQVIREVLKKVKEKSGVPLFAQVQDKIVLAITENGGIMEKKQLLKVLGKGNASEEAAVCFFLECTDAVKGVEVKDELSFSYMLPLFDIEGWRAVKNAAVKVLVAEKKPLSVDEMFELLKAEVKIEKDVFQSYLEVSEEIKQNTFEKWGIAKWKEISPKGTREKSYLVLKEAGIPLHFRDIAKKIDQYHLNKKGTHPQTVHNELIKDKNFVLVGRGIYALVEWGYKKGTVKDVIEEILKKSSKPLNRDEILKKVLDIRHVKKSTIVINLNNYFSKTKEGVYSIKKS
ncbi:MAG: sigma-70 region 4 domain protein [Parcubacteria group bacterium GW2011_GWC1_38_22]|nr:MAG: sigma-70 region 4 domain protein [Parcubacteria group bacterium GW2011_GWC1_38_22]